MSSSGEGALIAYLTQEQARFYRLAYSYLNNREDALDAVQTAVCRALERQDSLRSAGAMRGWFYRILINVCRDILRERGRSVPLEQWEDPGAEDPLPPDGSLFERVRALPEAAGTVVRLRFYEELSLKEIAAVTGCSINTVKSRLYSGLRKLRIAMEGAEIE